MVDILVPPVSSLVAARAYLLHELTARDNPLPVGVVPPTGDNSSYAMLSRPGGATNVFLADYLIRVQVFDADPVRLEHNADLLYRLMMTVSHRRIDTPEGSVWVTGASHHMSPSAQDDREIPLFGMQFAVFWTIGLRPESAYTPAP
jgi:hypothetical protein